MTATAPCPRCGAANPPEAGACPVRLSVLGDQAGVQPERASGIVGDPPLPIADRALALPGLAAASPARDVRSRLRRPLAAAGASLLISALGALAIYEVHRTMPPLPPGFERIARPQGLPSPLGGDEARWRHLQRPAPGSGMAVAEPPAPAGVPPVGATPLGGDVTAATGASQPSSPAQPRPATPASPERGEIRPPEAQAGERLASLQRAQCGDQALLARIVCNERVRLRFCRGRWNAHPDCEVSIPEALN